MREEIITQLSDLKNQITKLEEKIDQQDKMSADLVTQVDAMSVLLVNIISSQEISVKLMSDINYEILKQDIGAEEIMELEILIQKIKQASLKQNPLMTLQEFHEELLTIFNVSTDNKKDFSIEISKNLLLSCGLENVK